MKKIISSVIALVFAAGIVIVCGIGSSWFTNGDLKTWFNSWGKGSETSAPDEKPVENGAGIHNHARITSASLDADENAGIEFYALGGDPCLRCENGRIIYTTTQEATCTATGTKSGTCNSCGHTSTKSIAALGHNYSWTTTTAATCTATGVESYRCSRCWEVTDTRSVAALGHNYSWVITTAPTADAAGEASEICSRCDNVNDTRAVYALPADPVKEGYHFVGWYLDEAFTQPYDNSPIYEDTQLYAKFEINVYTVTFDSAGGTAFESVTIDWNNPLNTETPTKTGYNFVGWFKSDDTQFTDGEAIVSNMTLTAHWQIKVFTVTFYVNGEVFATKAVEYGSVLSEVADSAKIFARNVISFANVNDETPDTSVSEMLVTDDMVVVANEPTVWDRVLSYMPYIIGSVCLLVAIGVIAGVVEKKKRG